MEVVKRYLHGNSKKQERYQALVLFSKQFTILILFWTNTKRPLLILEVRGTNFLGTETVNRTVFSGISLKWGNIG